jgi:hypothetical protein
MFAIKVFASAVVVSCLCFGCSNSCVDLQAICNYCEDPNQKWSCEASVDRDDSAGCDRDISAYCGVCGRRGSTVVEECK